MALVYGSWYPPRQISRWQKRHFSVYCHRWSLMRRGTSLRAWIKASILWIAPQRFVTSTKISTGNQSGAGHAGIRLWDVLFLHMLCLQDKQSTQTTIADFYSTICVRLCGAMFHIYWETLSLFCWQRLLSCRKRCNQSVTTVMWRGLGTLSLLTWHKSMWFRLVS